MHVMALVRADPGVGGHRIVRQVRRELAKVHDVCQARRVALDIGIGDERIMLALVELVAAGRRQQVAVAQRQRLHVGLPGLAIRLKLIHDVCHVESHITIACDPIGRTGGCRDVVRLAGVRDAKIVGRQPISCRRRVNPGCVRVANQALIAGVLHHNDEDMLEVLEIRTVTIATASLRRNCEWCHQHHHQRKDYRSR